MNYSIGFRGALAVVLAMVVGQIMSCSPSDGNGNGNENVNENGGGQANPADIILAVLQGGQTDYTGFQDNAIPAEFFGPGSEPFSGTITLQGAPLTTDPPDALGAADTIVRRLQDQCPTDVGDSRTVDIEIVALNLVSIEPIIINFDGEQNAEHWDVQVSLSDQSQERGSMTMHLDQEEGGTFDSTIPVLPKFIFTRESDGQTQTLDCGESEQACDVLQLEGADIGWSVIGGPCDFDPEEQGHVQVTSGVQFDSNGDGELDDHTIDPSHCFYPGVNPTDCGESAFGEWAGTAGNYQFEGNCPGSGGTVSLLEINGTLVLRNLEENDDIPLTLEDSTAAADGIVAFTIGGHNLTMTLSDGSIYFLLEDPQYGGWCDANMTPLPQDRDCFESTGKATITMDVGDTECLNGGIELDLASAGFDTAVVELDPPPYFTDIDIETELVQLVLVADGGPLLGQVTIRERADKESTGLIENVVADDDGEFVSGDSFFDIFVEVEIGFMGLQLDSGDFTLRLDAGSIMELPPLNTDYLPPPDAEPVPLFILGTSNQFGWLCHAQHTPTQVVPCD